MTECYLVMSTNNSPAHVKQTIEAALPSVAALDEVGSVNQLSVYDFTFEASGEWEIVENFVRNIYDGGDSVDNFPRP